MPVSFEAGAGHLSIWLKLDNLTFRTEVPSPVPDDTILTHLIDVCKYSISRISVFRHASTIKRITIHVIFPTSSPSASFALRLVRNKTFLDQFRSLQLNIAGHLPSEFQLHVHLPPHKKQRGVVVRSIASDRTATTSIYRQEVRYYSEGKS